MAYFHLATSAYKYQTAKRYAKADGAARTRCTFSTWRWWLSFVGRSMNFSGLLHRCGLKRTRSLYDKKSKHKLEVFLARFRRFTLYRLIANRRKTLVIHKNDRSVMSPYTVCAYSYGSIHFYVFATTKLFKDYGTNTTWKKSVSIKASMPMIV